MSTIDLYDANERPTLTSLELWANSKIIGRECASINKVYLLCKQEKGENPAVCAIEAKDVLNCSSNM